jgi:hypothetical protein
MKNRQLFLIALLLIIQFNIGCGAFRKYPRDFAMTVDSDEYDAEIEPPIIDVSIIKDESSASNSPRVGNDRDEHGCIKSAGYTWSNLKYRCIRLFEEGIKLIPAGPNAQQDDITGLILNSYLIFSNDQMHAELYQPNQSQTVLFHKTSSDSDESVWISETYEIKLQNNRYTVHQFSLPIFTQQE